MSAKEQPQLQQQFVERLFAPHEKTETKENAALYEQPAKREHLLRCLAQVNCEIGETTAALVGAVVREPLLLQSLLHSTGELAEELAGLFTQSRAQLDLLDGENGAKQELLRALQQQATLQKEVERQDSIICALESLQTIQASFTEFQQRRIERDFCKALDALEAVDTVIANTALTNDTDIILRCRENRRQLQHTLSDELADAFSRLVTLEHGQKSVLTVHAQHQNISLADVVAAQHRIGTLHSQLQSLQQQIMRCLFRPLFTHRQGSMPSLQAVENGDIRMLELVHCSDQTDDEPSCDQQSADTFYSNLERGLRFIADAVLGYEDGTSRPEYATVFGSTVCRPLCGIVAKDYLHEKLPVERSELAEFTSTIDRTHAFEAVLCNLGKYSQHVEPTCLLLAPTANRHVATGMSNTDNSPLSAFANNLDRHYAEKKRKYMLDCGRRRLAKYDFELEYPAHKPWRLYLDSDSKLCSAQELPQQQSHQSADAVMHLALAREPFLFPQCGVSRTAVDLGRLLHDILAEACQLNADCALQFALAARALVSLFQATVPRQQARIIGQVPALAMQFHNDCMYLGHLLLVLGLDYGDHMPAGVSQAHLDFSDMVPFLRHMGEQHFNKQLAVQKDALLEAFDDLGGFYDAGEDDRYDKIQQTITQTVYSLRKLSDVWKPVLPSNLHNRAIGLLVDAILGRVITELLDLADISEVESYQLHKACQMLFELTKLVEAVDRTNANKTQVSAWIAHWEKYSQLVTLLELSFSDIMQRFRDGKLHMFSANELVGLIRALFSDTPLRQSNIAEIREKIGD
ncbi:Centromere/kinetochore Zw10-domain-containing protein [Thamnocephalis sphaerospora]|uniref:Centromere/kinetochore Zw10-domain-containing protein n=1 Tax=Thamnocephalis sphaerospora TaxID=78915 RepID=A0A4P9XQF8_9FUNG|nr:Centromere/kinetochore Zw10-domain-containing protein [Thamnocephalis sphaerospora]|eukprot:RKP08273.1 Centromere/kinetochore Zw10-domain-containing protein [Thamnocephalis sphaerospora]